MDDEPFAAVVDALSQLPDVDFSSGGRAFGSNALKVHGKIFAMRDARGQFVVKLPRDRVAGLVASGQAAPFETAPGRVMKEWAVVLMEAATWEGLAREAHAYVGGRP